MSLHSVSDAQGMIFLRLVKLHAQPEVLLLLLLVPKRLRFEQLPLGFWVFLFNLSKSYGILRCVFEVEFFQFSFTWTPLNLCMQILRYQKKKKTKEKREKGAS